MEGISAPDSDTQLTAEERREMLEEDMRRIKEEMSAVRAKYTHPLNIEGEDRHRLDILSRELEETLRDLALLDRKE